MKTRKPKALSDKLFVPPLPKLYDPTYQLESWLQTKVKDKYIPTKEYAFRGMLLPPLSPFMSLEEYRTYYSVKGDLDEKLSDKTWEGILELEKTEFPEEFKKNRRLQFLNRYLEKYGTGKEKKRIFLAPNTNHFHASWLFKRMLLFCKTRGASFELSDYKKGTIEALYNDEKKSASATFELPLLDPSFKKAFYLFCKKNTYGT